MTILFSSIFKAQKLVFCEKYILPALLCFYLWCDILTKLGVFIMIYDEIKKANILAMKEKDSVAHTIYSVLINKLMLEQIKKREKNEQLTDVDTIQILQKSVKELTEELENYKKVNNDEEVQNITKQIELVKSYLPKMMSEDEIKSIIMSLEDKSVPAVMKHFKANYQGKCDMRQVSEILKSM